MNEWVTLTSRCNNRCLFCYEHTPEGEPPAPRDEAPAALSGRLRAARERGVGGVVLTGGEPTMAATLAPAVAAARALGFDEIVLATNGRRLAYASYAERLARAGLTGAHVSLYSHDSRVHDGLTLAPGSFAQTVLGIRNLLRLGIPVTANFIVNRRTCQDLAVYLDLVRDLGVERVSVMGLKPFGGAFKHRAAVSFRPEDAAPSVSAAVAYGVACGLSIKTMGLSREIFDLGGTESDDHRARQYFEEMVAALPAKPYCAPLCATCFGRAVCRHGSRGLDGDRPRTPPSPGAFAAGVAVDATCRGEGDTPGCVFARGHLVYPGLACGQRCLLGETVPGSPEWQEALVVLARRLGSAVFVYGVDGATALRLKETVQAAGLAGRGDLCGAVLVAPASASTAAAVLPAGALGGARVGQRRGLRFAIETSDEAVDALHALYRGQCARLGVRPLPRSFITAERERAPAAFGIALARDATGEPVAGRLLLQQRNYLRIVDGGWRRDHAEARPEAFLVAALVDWALGRGVRIVDFGIAEARSEGLRAFKRGLGFREVGAVVELDPAPRKASVIATAPRARGELLPGRIDIAVGKRCNHDCLFCYRDAITREATAVEIEARIDEAASARFSGIALSGGEPTLRADLARLIRYARDRGLRDVQLHTNGSRIADAAYLATLVEAGLTSAMVSFHSHRPDGYLAITRRPHFEQARQALRNLLAAGVRTLLSHVVCGLNYADLPALPDYVAGEFPGAEIFFFFVYPGAKTERHPAIVPRLTDVEPYWYRALGRLGEVGVRYTVDCLAGFPPCYLRGFEPAAKILWMEDLRRVIGEEADDHIIKLSELTKPARCAACAHTAHCLGFWTRYLERFGEDELKPVRRGRSARGRAS
jgi:MoaA/NifB/PqqE/SkfB family radical SAM enzyme